MGIRVWAAAAAMAACAWATNASAALVRDVEWWTYREVYTYIGNGLYLRTYEPDIQRETTIAPITYGPHFIYIDLTHNATVVGSPLDGANTQYIADTPDEISYLETHAFRLQLNFSLPSSASASLGVATVSAPYDPELLAGVPEPSTWALMLLGFGGLAFVARRRSIAARAVG